MTNPEATTPTLPELMRTTADTLALISASYDGEAPSAWYQTIDLLRHEAAYLAHADANAGWPTMPDEHHVSVDLSTGRGPEVVEYARRRGITNDNAVRQMMNLGLSYAGPLDPTPLTTRKFQ